MSTEASESTETDQLVNVETARIELDGFLHERQSVQVDRQKLVLYLSALVTSWLADQHEHRDELRLAVAVNRENL